MCSFVIGVSRYMLRHNFAVAKIPNKSHQIYTVRKENRSEL